MGPAPYKVLRNQISPDQPDEKTFPELVEVLTKHYNPQQSETLQRYKFKQRIRKPGETVATLVAELRSIAEFCNFGASLEDTLRDQIMCGINEDGIQQKLFAEKTLTYQRALEIFRGLGTAAKSVKELKIGRRDLDGVVVKQEVNKVSHKKRKSKSPTATITCYRCGILQHSAKEAGYMPPVQAEGTLEESVPPW